MGVLVADGGKTSDAFLAGTPSAPADSITPKCPAFRIISASPAKQLGNKAFCFLSSARSALRADLRRDLLVFGDSGFSVGEASALFFLRARTFIRAIGAEGKLVQWQQGEAAEQSQEDEGGGGDLGISANLER